MLLFIFILKFAIFLRISSENSDMSKANPNFVMNEDIKEIERQDYEAISSIYAQRSLINGRAKRVVQFEENWELS